MERVGARCRKVRRLSLWYSIHGSILQAPTGTDRIVVGRFPVIGSIPILRFTLIVGRVLLVSRIIALVLSHKDWLDKDFPRFAPFWYRLPFGKGITTANSPEEAHQDQKPNHGSENIDNSQEERSGVPPVISLLLPCLFRGRNVGRIRIKLN